jgi:hypothetical protein
MARSSCSVKSARKPARKNRPFLLQKPNGQIHQRVQAIGPERFGVVAIDGAKLRSKFFFCDFYGRVLIEPTLLGHSQPEFKGAQVGRRPTSLFSHGTTKVNRLVAA